MDSSVVFAAEMCGCAANRDGQKEIAIDCSWWAVRLI